MQEPEQQLGPGVIERGEAELINDDQVVAEQVVDDAADGVVGQGPVEDLGEVGGPPPGPSLAVARWLKLSEAGSEPA